MLKYLMMSFVKASVNAIYPQQNSLLMAQFTLTINNIIKYRITMMI